MKRMMLFSCMLFLFCGHLFSQGRAVSKTCKGMLINGVCWAECNVDSPGTFAATPEAYGMLYQWNRKKGWPATGNTVTGWDSSTPTGDSWEAVNDPCPFGWRVPTTEEIATLQDDSKVTYTWTSQNGVNGKKCTDKVTGNAIFLPAAGFRSFLDGGLGSVDSEGLYWSGSSVSGTYAWSLVSLGDAPIGQIPFPMSFGYSVRCVADSDFTGCDSIVKDTSETICAGDLPYTWGDTVFQAGTETGKYRFQRISKVTGCDSIVYLSLTVHPEPHLSFSDAVCYGSGYTGNGFNLPSVFADTLVSDTLQSLWGCDSIRSLYLTVHPSYNTTIYDTIYQGDSYNEYGFSLPNVESGGPWHLHLLSRSGCDSTLSLYLFIREQTVSKTCQGMLINGVCWAECNVDSPGTFAATPEAYGMLYQWNRKKGWPVTGPVTGWDSSFPSGNSWETANDPCPPGWRVPSKEEMATLLDGTKVTSVRTSQNGVYGRQFTDEVNGNVIFLPSVGYRSGNSIMIDNPNYNGWYWSSSSSYTSLAWILFFLNTYEVQQINFPGTMGFTVRCVADSDFTGCDNIVKDTSETICAGDLPYTWGDTVFQAGTETGKCRFQRISKVTGCDSIVYLSLTVHPEPHLSFSDAVCYGSGYTGNGFNLPSVFADTLVSDTLQSLWGCDSIRSLYLTVHPSYNTTFYDTVCPGDSYCQHGFSLPNVQSGGSFQLPLQTLQGCDSIITLNLYVCPSYFYPRSENICQGDTMDFRDRRLYESGVYYDSLTTIKGCDSIYCLSLTVHPEPHLSFSDVVCYGSGYTGNGFDLPSVFADTLVKVTLQSLWGCDSIRSLYLTVHPSYNTTFYDTVCPGDSYYQHGFSLPNVQSGGSFQLPLQTVHGCDSIITLNLYVCPAYFYPRSENICQGDTMDFRDRRLYESGVYYDSLTTVKGCDSIYCLSLMVHPVYDIQFSGVLCEGTSYTEHGFDVSRAGVYHRYLKTNTGCDSIITLNLTEEKKTQGSIVFLLKDCITHAYTFFFEPEQPFTSCQWDMGDGTVFYTEKGVHMYVDSGVYRIQLRTETSNGCENTFSCVQYVPPYLPEVQLQADRQSIDKDFPTVHFRAEVLPEMSCVWDFGDGMTGKGARVSHTYPAVNSEKYYDVILRVINADSCITESRVQIETFFSQKSVNTFSPNGDGINDVFMSGCRIEILNRNGIRVYAGNDGWDGTWQGKQVPEDTYFYRLYEQTANGEKIKIGYVTLVR